nr:AraC family transcriptional regulator [uncultured Steroidobacter sp.]
MNPINRALWYIESHLKTELSLESLAAHANVSPFYLTRAFNHLSGLPIMRYVRGRRLSVAARALANGAPDVLSVALEAGYGSHEAFTRAFRDQFGMTPEAVRAQGHVDNLAIVEPIAMTHQQLTNLEPPRFEEGKALLLAGIGARYKCENKAGIPSQWERFLSYFGHIPDQVDNVAYGVVHNVDDGGNIEYLCGAQVRDFSRTPPELSTLRLAPQRYAIFKHRDHVSAISGTFAAIWGRWVPESGHAVVDAPTLEVYGPEFDSKTGHGGFEIWVPIKS